MFQKANTTKNLDAAKSNDRKKSAGTDGGGEGGTSGNWGGGATIGEAVSQQTKKVSPSPKTHKESRRG